MAKWIISWNAGDGDYYEIAEAHNKASAIAMAYDGWLEEALENAAWNVEPYSKEQAVELCLEDDDEE